MKKKNKNHKEITDYDNKESTHFINSRQKLKFEDLGLTLPPTPTTQVVSIRLPTELLNALRALGSQKDVPYQALIKIFLADRIKKELKKAG